MSSCLILQDKNNFYIGADTACSVNIDGKYYRYSSDIEKIFIHGNDTYFCSGNLLIVNFVNSWINKQFYKQQNIDVELLSNFLKHYCPKSSKDIFDIEIIICRKENNISKIYQLSQYNNYNPIIFDPKENGINIICCGYKTQNIYNTTKQILFNEYKDIESLYQNVFDSIYDNVVGGYITLYTNGRKILHTKIHEDNIRYASDVNDCHLLIAEAVLSGYIESSTIKGGTIQIGEQEDGTFAFEVHEDGSVTMGGGSTISGYVREEDFNAIKSELTIVSDVEPIEAKEGQMWLDTSTDPYTLMVYTNGEWTYFSQQDGGKVYTSRPEQYNAGDLWILADGETYGEYGPGSILKADENLNWVDALSGITDVIENVRESFTWNEDGIQIAKKVTDASGNSTYPFYVHLDSTRMGFHSVDDRGNDAEVVHIGNNSSTIQNATFEGSDGTTFKNNVTFNQQINMNRPDFLTGFAFKIEENGSFSLAAVEEGVSLSLATFNLI